MPIDKEHDLSISNYGTVRKQSYTAAFLPWGATEPHNLHLPYLTDCILAHDVAVTAARRAQEKHGIRTMVLPPINMGAQNPGQRELPFCIHARYETQKAILTDIVASLYVQGIRTLVIVNGHGGNSFKNMIRDLAVDYPDFLTVASDWFAVVPAKEFFEAPGEHADELETSAMMYFHPELVNLAEAGTGAYKPFAAPSLREKTAWIPRNWQKVTEDTGIGDPHGATAEKGKRFVEAVVEKYADLLYDLSRPIYD